MRAREECEHGNGEGAAGMAGQGLRGRTRLISRFGQGAEACTCPGTTQALRQRHRGRTDGWLGRRPTHRVRTIVDQACTNTADDRGPWLDCRAACSYAHETSQDAVAGVHHLHKAGVWACRLGTGSAASCSAVGQCVTQARAPAEDAALRVAVRVTCPRQQPPGRPHAPPRHRCASSGRAGQ